MIGPEHVAAAGILPHRAPPGGRPGSPASGPARSPRDLGIRLIVTYKLVKGAGEALAAIALGVALQRGVTEALQHAAAFLHEHVVAQWSTRLAAALLRSLTPRHLAFLNLGLALDAALTLVEGWALHRRRWWASWLIVAATASLLPLELASLAHRVQVGRVALLAINLAVVTYLLTRARRERQVG